VAAVIGNFAESAFLDESPVVGNGGREWQDFIGIIKNQSIERLPGTVWTNPQRALEGSNDCLPCGTELQSRILSYS